jgi:hypothetical protein
VAGNSHSRMLATVSSLGKSGFIDEGISVTMFPLHLWSLLSVLPFLIFSCVSLLRTVHL